MEELTAMLTTFLIKAIENHPTVSSLAAILIAFEGVAPMVEALARKIVSFTKTKKDDELVERLFSSNLWAAAKSFAGWVHRVKR
ncbi:MAG: hypothetical protein AB8G05_01295 [Oligoflexales bacterium]